MYVINFFLILQRNADFNWSHVFFSMMCTKYYVAL